MNDTINGNKIFEELFSLVTEPVTCDGVTLTMRTLTAEMKEQFNLIPDYDQAVQFITERGLVWGGERYFEHDKFSANKMIEFWNHPAFIERKVNTGELAELFAEEIAELSGIKLPEPEVNEPASEESDDDLQEDAQLVG